MFYLSSKFLLYKNATDIRYVYEVMGPNKYTVPSRAVISAVIIPTDEARQLQPSLNGATG